MEGDKMIKVLEVKNIKEITRNKKTFKEGEVYKCHMKDNQFFVTIEDQRIPFDWHRPSRLRSGEEVYFNIYFEEVKEGYVRNKKELKDFLKSDKSETLYREKML